MARQRYDDQWNNRVGRELATRLKQQWAADNAPCWLCDQPIDYTAPPNHPDSVEADHVLPRKTHPELSLDPGNIKPAHSSCNRAKGERDAPPKIGVLSYPWFAA